MSLSVSVPRYRIFIDESGDHGFKNLNDDSPPGQRYFCLTGCVFKLSKQYQNAVDKIIALKKKYWPNDFEPIILHTDDIKKASGKFSILRNPETRKEFDKDLLEILSEMQFTIICVVLDKLAQKNKYTTCYDPYNFSLEVMLERYCGYLKNVVRSQGDVMCEARNPNLDKKVKKRYIEIFRKGNDKRPKEFFQGSLTSDQIKIKPKIKNIAGLQISDMVGYPIKQKILFEKNRAVNYLGTFNEKIYHAINDKLNRQIYKNQISGYGEIFLDFHS